MDAVTAEWLGYLASALVAVSLMMSNMLALRWINLAGAFLFCVYATWIAAYPVLALNLFVSATNIYYIIQLTRK